MSYVNDNEKTITPRLEVKVLSTNNRLGVIIPMPNSKTAAVLYVQQDLSKSEQSVARNNIGITDEMYANMSGEIVNEDFQVMGVTVGNYTDGQWIRAKKPDGTPHTTWEVIKEMLTKVIDVIAHKPTITLHSTSSVDRVELGSTLTQTFSVTYTDGYFSGQSGYTYHANAGCVRGETTYKRGNTIITTTDTTTFTTVGNVVFSAQTDYEASTVTPIKNDGTESSVNIPSGVTDPSTKTIVVGKKIFYGNVAAKITTNEQVRALGKWEWSKAVTVTLDNIGSGIIVVMPKNRVLTVAVTGNNQYLKDSTKDEFEHYEITIEYADGTTEQYNAMLFKPATAMETNVTITIE